MKKVTGLAMVVILCIGIFAACGKNSYDAETNTIYILKKGKIVSKDVESFDEDVYKNADLKDYVENAIREYTDENGKNSVKFESLSVEDNTASLILKYASASDYADFTGTDLFTGTVTEALAAGYTFEEEFVDTDGKTCDTATVLDDSSLKVAIVKGNLNVHVSGEIVYFTSRNVVLVDKNTISIDPAYNVTEQEGTETLEIIEGTEQATEGIIEEWDESGDAESDSGSVSDDELLTGEESTEMTFDFDETYHSQSGEGEISDVYTYVIYR